ncbi:TnsD family Tn7-like transposition protein [Shewanella sp. ULN5]|uniref:TnsD family Tn7-like transposition protein n=1 Tax=Shewanella sp. ULN5 TaxID=2994678 RepID=UPI00273F7769|nr:TnsD family Tn7-like transposition protein [Shewanella sp. ULN5]MDP5147506.1 TnsD family Tn7-like transposition protein [Shewanella sp. ULN5]
MLTYFTVPYDDELLYSCIARYGCHTGQAQNQKAVVRDVWGTDSAVAIPDLPSHLQDFVDNVGTVWKVTINELIAQFTLAPLYIPFLSDQQARQVLSSMESKFGGNIHTRAGIVASRVPIPAHFRYCPQCLEEQLAELGEPYWRRMHQLPIIDVCIIHSCKLEDSAVPFHPKQKHHYCAAILECHSRQARYVELTELERRVIEYHKELLDVSLLEGLGTNRWTLYYQELAKERGLTHKSRVQHEIIHQSLIKAWKGTLLEPILPGMNENSWLTNLFRKHRKSFHPLRHLMVLSVLTPDKKLSEILQQVKTFPPEQVRTKQVFKVTGNTHEEIKAHRNEWVKLMAVHPNYGVKKLRKLNPGGRIYAWLYRNDYPWLMQNCPKKETSPEGIRDGDYPSWDKQNVRVLTSIYKDLFQSKGRKRLTTSHLIQKLPRANSVQKHLVDLPLTKQWLSLHAESLEDYQVFRLKLAYQHLTERHQTIKRWRLIRVANIREELVTERIEREIIALKKLWRSRQK